MLPSAVSAELRSIREGNLKGNLNDDAVLGMLIGAKGKDCSRDSILLESNVL
jgi:hypothetical protein